MADQLYLSLWFPNFRLDTLPAALVSVLRQFALVSGTPTGKRVSAASAYPISFNESPTYQRIYVNDSRAEDSPDTAGGIIENAVSEATEHLHDDMAYEFEMKWNLWTPDAGPGSAGYTQDTNSDPDQLEAASLLDTLWRPEPKTVKVIGFGPHFDEGSFEQNGHIRVDFGLDYPWVLDEEDDDLDDLDDLGDEEAEAAGIEAEEADRDDTSGPGPTSGKLLSFNRPKSSSNPDPQTEAATYIQKNVEMLLAFTLSVEKHCNISSRLLWTESGEPLAEKLIARLQRLN